LSIGDIIQHRIAEVNFLFSQDRINLGRVFVGLSVLGLAYFVCLKKNKKKREKKEQLAFWEFGCGI